LQTAVRLEIQAECMACKV